MKTLYKKPSKGGRDAQWGHGSKQWREALAKYSGPQGCEMAAQEWLQASYQDRNSYRGFLGELIAMVEGWRK